MYSTGYSISRRSKTTSNMVSSCTVQLPTWGCRYLYVNKYKFIDIYRSDESPSALSSSSFHLACRFDCHRTLTDEAQSIPDSI